MTSQELSSFAAILLSLAFSYIPGVKDAYDQLDGVYKRLVMLLALVITTGAVFGLACWTPPIFPGVTCDKPGAIDLVKAFIQAVIANQSVYLITPKSAKKAPDLPAEQPMD